LGLDGQSLVQLKNALFSQPVEHFTGFGNEQNPLVFAVGVVGWIDGGGWGLFGAVAGDCAGLRSEGGGVGCGVL